MTADYLAKWAASKPRKGDPITYNGTEQGIVERVEGGLCWVRYHEPKTWLDRISGRTVEETCLPFIWAFRDTLNTLHDWPTKGSQPS